MGLCYLISGIKVPVEAEEGEILKKAGEKMKRAGISTATLHFRLYKKSLDARRRGEFSFVCTVAAVPEEGDAPIPAEKLARADAKAVVEAPPENGKGSENAGGRPLVVGMGPAGIFAALFLARNGYRPILIDRGGSVEERAKAVERFRENGILDPESNIQFGAGGAGTFSDGKLVTRISDPRCSFVLKTFVEAGAPGEILYLAKPHIGTDLLRGVISRLLGEIAALGGDVRYHCRMDSFERMSDGSLKVRTSQGEILCGGMILAPGHSSRDTYKMLISSQFAVEPKPISVGVRAEHLQARLDEAMLGKEAGNPHLGHAEYTLSDTRGERGVYTFCMCPGGEVVAAASEEGGLVVNGMSRHARDGKNANAAVAVSVGVADYEPVEGNLALGAIAFQRKIERAAFIAGGKDYYAPIMTAGDFLGGRRGTEPTAVQPSYRGGKVRTADFSEVFPRFVTESIGYGLVSFGKKIRGYDAPDTILTAAETRTSAPVRILRDRESGIAIGNDRIYPAGEGAGYAGGITSAAVDGIGAAQAYMKRFAPYEKQ